MTRHGTLSPSEAADRLAIRELIEAYAPPGSTLRLWLGRPTARPSCSVAHHVTADGDKRRLVVASLRYLDTFVKTAGTWLFSERSLYVDWVEERALS